MYKIIYPTKDATIYEKYSNRNTGIDEILELTKFTIGERYQDITDEYEYSTWDKTYNSRILIKFDLSDINTIPSKCYLSLIATEANALPLEYTLETYPLAESWVNGNGHYNDEPEITNGVSWNYKSGYSAADTWDTASYAHSFATINGGGTWHSTYHATQSFNYQSPDVFMNVTPIITNQIQNNIANNGIIIKHTDVNEQNTLTLGSIKFFGNETHTIYKPKLILFWDDSNNYTGSFNSNQLISNEFIIFISNLQNIYTQGESRKLRISVRDKFPTKSYVKQSSTVTSKRLPSTSYFSIIDSVTGINIVPFDNIGTKILTDDNGHYILLDTSSFSKKRYYKIIFKIIKDNEEQIIDNDYNFRIE